MYCCINKYAEYMVHACCSFVCDDTTLVYLSRPDVLLLDGKLICAL